MAASRKIKAKTIRLWSAQDVKQLSTMARQKLLASAIAKKLRRTVAAVYTKAHEQSISLKK